MVQPVHLHQHTCAAHAPKSDNVVSIFLGGESVDQSEEADWSMGKDLQAKGTVPQNMRSATVA